MSEAAEAVAELPGARIAYLDTEGDAQRAGGEPAPGQDRRERPVLLLHGWPQSREMWRPMIPLLSPARRVIAPDLRGFGRSEAPGHGYDVPTFVADQLALLDRLGIERADVIGHDWGGWTAFLLALEHPERIGALTVLNSPHPWPRIDAHTAAQLPRSWYALALATPGLGPALLRRGGLAATILRWDAGSAIDPDRVAAWDESFRPPERAAAISALYRYYFRAFAQIAAGRWRHHRLSRPALLLFGERDRMISPRVVREGFEDHADNARIELVPGCGHFIVDERPQLVAERALALLEETRPLS